MSEYSASEMCDEAELSHREAMANIFKSISDILARDPLLRNIGIPAEQLTSEEVESLIALERGQAMRITVERADNTSFRVIVRENAHVADLKRAIKRFVNLEQTRKNGRPPSLSWKHVWRVNWICFDKVRLKNNHDKLKDLGIVNRSHVDPFVSSLNFCFVLGTRSVCRRECSVSLLRKVFAMDAVSVVENVAVVLTVATFFMGVPTALNILEKKRADPGEIIGFTIGIAQSIAWGHVGYWAQSYFVTLQTFGFLINGTCMLIYFIYAVDKSIVVKHTASLLAMHLGLTYFALNIAPSAEWAFGGILAFAMVLNAVCTGMPLLSINEVKRHRCTYPMGMNLRNSILLLLLTFAWGLHGFLSGDLGSFIFNIFMTSAWAVMVYYNLIFPFEPPSGLKKKVPGFTLKRVATSIKDFGDKMSNFTLEDFGGFGEEKND
ncbi:unnamed protein product [Notodromas monacha]|uniref:SNRNP25 ubiquitin-like domain-containing protein n=1 Tax=Notodromas monacha TaxID=399045 RepID=A0A7R9BYM7_9CRUS|nr:unnamed protein product [Notodromas monacha]CAG0922681.1 unnamed protein product [Notodromas monacha]